MAVAEEEVAEEEVAQSRPDLSQSAEAEQQVAAVPTQQSPLEAAAARGAVAAD